MNRSPGRSPVLLLLLGLAARTGGLAAADWPEWRGAQRDGVWRDVRLPERFGRETVREKWRVPVGGGYSGIAVSAGRVFTMDRREEPRPVERVLCFSRDGGDLLWSHEYPVDYGDMDHANGPRATPTVDGTRLFTLGARGHVLCLDAADGRILWQLDSAREHRTKLPMWGQASSPLVHEDVVILSLGGRPGGTVMAFDRKTGKKRWSALDDRPGYSSPVAAEVGGRPQLIVWTADNVVALSPANGDVLWKTPFRTTSFDVAIISPVVRDGRLFVSGYWDGTRVFKLSGRETPELLWKDRRRPSCLMSTPLSRDDYLYVLDKKEGLLCVEWASGRVLWSDNHRMTPRGRSPHASLVWAGDRAVALNSLGELLLVDLRPSGYRELGRVKIVGKTWAHPAFSGQQVFARSDSELVCFEIRPGEPPRVKE